MLTVLCASEGSQCGRDPIKQAVVGSPHEGGESKAGYAALWDDSLARRAKRTASGVLAVCAKKWPPRIADSSASQERLAWRGALGAAEFGPREEGLASTLGRGAWARALCDSMRKCGETRRGRLLRAPFRRGERGATKRFLRQTERGACDPEDSRRRLRVLVLVSVGSEAGGGQSCVFCTPS